MTVCSGGLSSALACNAAKHVLSIVLSLVAHDAVNIPFAYNLPNASILFIES